MPKWQKCHTQKYHQLNTIIIHKKHTDNVQEKCQSGGENTAKYHQISPKVLHKLQLENN